MNFRFVFQFWTLWRCCFPTFISGQRGMWNLLNSIRIRWWLIILDLSANSLRPYILSPSKSNQKLFVARKTFQTTNHPSPSLSICTYTICIINISLELLLHPSFARLFNRLVLFVHLFFAYIGKLLLSQGGWMVERSPIRLCILLLQRSPLCCAIFEFDRQPGEIYPRKTWLLSPTQPRVSWTLSFNYWAGVRN